MRKVPHSNKILLQKVHINWDIRKTKKKTIWERRGAMGRLQILGHHI